MYYHIYDVYVKIYITLQNIYFILPIKSKKKKKL